MSSLTDLKWAVEVEEHGEASRPDLGGISHLPKVSGAASCSMKDGEVVVVGGNCLPARTDLLFIVRNRDGSWVDMGKGLTGSAPSARMGATVVPTQNNTLLLYGGEDVSSMAKLGDLTEARITKGFRQVIWTPVVSVKGEMKSEQETNTVAAPVASTSNAAAAAAAQAAAAQAAAAQAASAAAPPARPSARAWHSAVGCFVDGEWAMVIYGGIGEKGRLLDDVWCYKPSLNCWRKLEPSGDGPGKLAYHTATAVTGAHVMVVIGGEGKKGARRAKRLYLLDLRTLAWKSAKVEGLHSCLMHSAVAVPKVIFPEELEKTAVGISSSSRTAANSGGGGTIPFPGSEGGGANVGTSSNNLGGGGGSQQNLIWKGAVRGPPGASPVDDDDDGAVSGAAAAKEAEVKAKDVTSGKERRQSKEQQQQRKSVTKETGPDKKADSASLPVSGGVGGQSSPGLRNAPRYPPEDIVLYGGITDNPSLMGGDVTFIRADGSVLTLALEETCDVPRYATATCSVAGNLTLLVSFGGACVQGGGKLGDARVLDISAASADAVKEKNRKASMASLLASRAAEVPTVTVELPHGQGTFKGVLNVQGLPHGHGTCVGKSTTYTGDWVEGRREGTGEMATTATRRTTLMGMNYLDELKPDTSSLLMTTSAPSRHTSVSSDILPPPRKSLSSSTTPGAAAPRSSSSASAAAALSSTTVPASKAPLYWYRGMWHNNEPHGEGEGSYTIPPLSTVGHVTPLHAVTSSSNGNNRRSSSSHGGGGGGSSSNKNTDSDITPLMPGDVVCVTSYSGEWSEGLPQGSGKGVLLSGLVYDGEWLLGLPHGQGKLYSERPGEAHMYQEGHFIEGILQQGIRKFERGGEYSGTFLKCRPGIVGEMQSRNGHGTFTWKDGSEYVGEWKSDKRNGIGTFRCSITRVEYTGKWVGDVKCGKGTAHYAAGHVYTGMFKDDLRDGQGEMQYANGDVYVGEWKHDKRNGQGVFETHAHGTTVSGLWRDDEFIA